MKPNPGLRSGRFFRSARQQKGVFVIWATLIMTGMIAIAALVINFSYLFVTKQDIHNAADAGALKGAGYFFFDDSYVPIFDSPPNFSLAQLEAVNGAVVNQVNGELVAGGEVTTETGYWDFTTHTLTNNDALTPGIKVTVTKSPLALLFSNVFGVSIPALSVSAIAIAPSPGTVPAGTLQLPFVMHECVYDELRAAVSTWKIYDDGEWRHDPGCPGGSLASLTSSTSAATLVDFINGTTVAPGAEIGTPMIMGSGSPVSVYKAIEDCMAALCADPVVVAVVGSTDRGTTQSIVGFACVQVVGVQDTGTVSQRYVEVKLIQDGCKSGLANYMGPDYGVSSPPRLVY